MIIFNVLGELGVVVGSETFVKKDNKGWRDKAVRWARRWVLESSGMNLTYDLGD
jgi:hypothetical protein